jgi:hypothetical protein
MAVWSMAAKQAPASCELRKLCGTRATPRPLATKETTLSQNATSWRTFGAKPAVLLQPAIADGEVHFVGFEILEQPRRVGSG